MHCHACDKNGADIHDTELDRYYCFECFLPTLEVQQEMDKLDVVLKDISVEALYKMLEEAEAMENKAWESNGFVSLDAVRSQEGRPAYDHLSYTIDE